MQIPIHKYGAYPAGLSIIAQTPFPPDEAHTTIRFNIARTYTQPELSSRRNYPLDSIFCTTRDTARGRFPGTFYLWCYVIKLQLLSALAHRPCRVPACSGSPITVQQPHRCTAAPSLGLPAGYCTSPAPCASPTHVINTPSSSGLNVKTVSQSIKRVVCIACSDTATNETLNAGTQVQVHTPCPHTERKVLDGDKRKHP